MWSDVEEIFEEFEDQAWDDSSKLILLTDFLKDEAMRDPELWKRLSDRLQSVADEENGVTEGEEDDELDD